MTDSTPTVDAMEALRNCEQVARHRGEAQPKPLLTKWTPTTDLMTLRRTGKSLEELGELVAVVARCIIQGIDEIDPGSGKVNRVRLEDEIADVVAQCYTTINAFDLDDDRIRLRVIEKQRQMAEWEAMFKDDPAQPAAPEPALPQQNPDAARLIRLRKNVGNAEYERQCEAWLAAYDAAQTANLHPVFSEDC